ncbi:MAG: hypothetical protein GY815_17000 [Gammaproteobacteria bacterium]|nr:hypothetical protein [Gammaproteobacteria bacterium]
MTYQPIALDTDTRHKITCFYGINCRGAGGYYIAEQLREWAMSNQDERYNFTDYAAHIYDEYGISLEH